MKARALPLMAVVLWATTALAAPAEWRGEWPNTDFSRHSVDYAEIISGGPPRDGIPAIDAPRFKALDAVDLADSAPVIGLTVNGDSRAYPLGILTWHEIANDTVGEVPVAVTYCPLCNAAIVFDRRVGGQVLSFGTTGKLRHSDLVMYDRQSESWWQQFTGAAIVGARTGTVLETLPARLESFADFRRRAPDGKVLVPTDPDLRDYGKTPYVGYDSAGFPFLFRGEVPGGVAPLGRVIVIGDRAWTFDLLRARGQVEVDDLVLTWRAGQNSALDTRRIADGRDVGGVIAQRRVDGTLVDTDHHITFAFVFFAFQPDGRFFQ